MQGGIRVFLPAFLFQQLAGEVARLTVPQHVAHLRVVAIFHGVQKRRKIRGHPGAVDFQQVGKSRNPDLKEGLYAAPAA